MLMPFGKYKGHDLSTLMDDYLLWLAANIPLRDPLLSAIFYCNEGLDDSFFYSVPTSFFVLNEHIPPKLRELLTEGEGCLKSNFLTGASVCARKVIYELAVLQRASGDNYDERIKSLKELKPEVDPTFFDSLLTVQQATSNKVHENSYDGWNAKHLRLIFSTLREIFTEIYATPALKKERRQAILDLKQEILGNEAPPKPEMSDLNNPTAHYNKKSPPADG